MLFGCSGKRNWLGGFGFNTYRIGTANSFVAWFKCFPSACRMYSRQISTQTPDISNHDTVCLLFLSVPKTNVTQYLVFAKATSFQIIII
jgi:hypothetical protein